MGEAGWLTELCRKSKAVTTALCESSNYRNFRETGPRVAYKLLEYPVLSPWPEGQQDVYRVQALSMKIYAMQAASKGNKYLEMRLSSSTVLERNIGH